MHRALTALVSATLLLVAVDVAVAQDFDHTHAAYDAILKANVSNGRVDYKGLTAAPTALDRYLNTLAAVSEQVVTIHLKQNTIFS